MTAHGEEGLSLSKPVLSGWLASQPKGPVSNHAREGPSRRHFDKLSFILSFAEGGSSG